MVRACSIKSNALTYVGDIMRLRIGATMKKLGLRAEEKTAVLAVLATLGVIVLFLAQSQARATSEAAAKDLYTVCATLDEIAPEARQEHHIAAACAHPEWFSLQEPDPARTGGEDDR